ncbi:response regulator receiver modulated diguanylate cyclase [Thauera phenylacetica B4P]|uniref:diguanylate cyclase n=1 Tax=Thauera phenylacetica B4P TaxID=1234382 RepID=N6ZPN0_9RHOO|nr:diguanylate cyclase [Thauera phenylacetica]ENO96288.1 response regulator receiver modulated diguanylate cyclase [Thauera phenylacetica B4P]
MPQPIDMKRYAQLKAAGDLPSPRGVALAIIRLTQSPDVSLAELGRVIKGDPAFVGRLIKAANGLIAENRRAIVSVQEALMVLGLPAVRTLALGFSLLSTYRKGTCQGFDYPRFWSSALLMAISMQALTQRVRVVAPDEAFSLGLLARVGELSLATLYPEAFSRLLAELKRDHGLQQVVLEDQAFAMNHRELGAAMLADWGVPDALVQPVRFHEQPELAGYGEESREAGIVQCLVLARAVAQLCLAPEPEHVRLMAPMLRLAGRLGLGRGEFVSLCERVGRDWAEWGKLLQIRTEDAPRFVEVGNAAAEAAGEPARVVAEGDGPQPMRALVVAGARDDRELLRKEFEAAGVAAFVTAGADAALEAALDIQPQLVVADWSDEGERVVRGLRDMRLGRGVYVICMLDDEDEAPVLAASSAGADDFLVRPLQRAALTVRLRACLRMLVLQQELEHEREELRNFAAELSISNRRLQEAALTDPLTGLPNRRQAIEAMQAEWATATRHSRAFSVMIVDLDGFKAINDTHGHDVGDMALRQAAETLRGALRTQDLICRTGGDEFLVLCPDTDLRAAMLVAERLRVAVEARPVETGGPRIFLTASLGVAMRVPDMDNVDALIKCADDGVYRAKQRGRNCLSALQLESGAG